MSSPAFLHSDFIRIVPASAKSLGCRLYLEPAGAHQGMLDGGWWPRSANACAELPRLILMIDAVPVMMSEMTAGNRVAGSYRAATSVPADMSRQVRRR